MEEKYHSVTVRYGIRKKEQNSLRFIPVLSRSSFILVLQSISITS